jgi:hypothetical protein
MTDTSISVAFIGNSMQYYNDLPRLSGENGEETLRRIRCRPGTY